MSHIRKFGCLSLLAFLAAPIFAQEEKITLEPREKWTNLAAESKVEFNFTLKAPRAIKGRVEWTFSDPGTKRVFPAGRGEAKVAADAGKLAMFTIKLAVPPVNPGVILQAQLIVTVFEDGKKETEPPYEKTLWIFHADPFVNRAKWVKDLKITLFDPDAKSKTAEALKGLKVPFDESRNPAGLAEMKEGLLLIGEGVSLKDEAGLAEAMIQAASRGVPVVCLAPKDGTLPLPGADNALPMPGSLNLQHQDIIAKLDKRLDAAAWAPKNQVVVRSLALKTEDGKVIGEMQDGAKGWPWLQIDYPAKKSRLVLVGFPIIEQWEASPTPRFLLARLFEHVTELSENDPPK